MVAQGKTNELNKELFLAVSNISMPDEGEGTTERVPSRRLLSWLVLWAVVVGVVGFVICLQQDDFRFA